MKSPEINKGVSQEKNREQGKRIQQIILDVKNLSFIKNSNKEISKEDLSAWHKIIGSLIPRDFISPDEFMGAIEIELNNEEWTDKELPPMIMEKLKDLIDILDFKDKNARS